MVRSRATCREILVHATHDPSHALILAEKYEDPAGLLLPPETEAFLDTWKRPGELVQNLPDVPMLRIKPGSVAAVDPKGAWLTAHGSRTSMHGHDASFPWDTDTRSHYAMTPPTP